jgi:hypothetical protein
LLKALAALLIAVTLACVATASHAANQPVRSQPLTAPPELAVYQTLNFQVNWRPDELDFGPPEGATAKCRDGRYSFALERHAACSQHRGVVEWLQTL